MKRMWLDWLENNREELEQKYIEQNESKFEEWTLEHFDGCY